MSDTTKHTPLPWSESMWTVTGPCAAADLVAQNAVRDFDNGVHTVTVAQAQGTGKAAICTVYGESEEEAEANAALIAHSANSHQALIDALEVIKHSMQQALVHGNDKRREIELSLNTSVAALELAKGKAQNPVL